MLLPVPALPLGPALGACSTAAQECPISELRTRLSPSLPAPALPPGHAHGKAGPRGAVFFSPANPPLISAVREFWLRCPLLTLHHLSTISINIVNGGLLKGNEEAGYQRDVPWDVSPCQCLGRAILGNKTPGADARRSIASRLSYWLACWEKAPPMSASSCTMKPVLAELR